MNDQSVKPNFKFARYGWVIALIIGLVIGYISSGNSQKMNKSVAKVKARKTIYTCSMHPNVRKTNPNDKCPICFMDLIPLEETSSSKLNPEALKLSDRAKEMAEVKTAKVITGNATKSLNLTGTIQFDETKIQHITAWVNGRIDRLFINYTGIPVKAGDHMAEFYSPELISAHEELLRTSNNPKLFNAAKERLAKWGITQEQIAAMEKAKQPSEKQTIYSTVSGLVIEKFINEGMYVKQGAKLFSISDIKSLWLILSAYESDIQWIKYGQEVNCEVDSFPGEIFKGTVSFVSPILDTKNRAINVRVNLKNPYKKLKPGMFARANIKIQLDKNGKAIGPNLSGKWISPMHPEIIKDSPGKCDVCGMDLVPIESIQSKLPIDYKHPLLIPDSSVLWTGKRSIIYRELKHEKNMYEPVEITLGPKVDNYYLVFDGLKEGDTIVTEGAFKIDSEQQIRGKLSMMNMKKQIPKSSHSSQDAHLKRETSEHFIAIKEKLKKLTINCLEIAQELASDNHIAAKQAAQKAQKQMSAIFKLKSNNQLISLLSVISSNLNKISESSDIAKARIGLNELTPNLQKLFTKFGNPLEQEVYKMNCPMAFDNNGADWFQTQKELANPYYGAMMLKCGSIKATLPPSSNPEN